MPISAEPARILVVDDHPVVRQGIVHIINEEPDLTVCAEAANTTEAMRSVAQDNPHLVLLDLALGEESGLELIKDLKAQYPELKILVLSIHDSYLYAERVLKAGALGFINKNTDIKQLVTAVKRTLKGSIYLSEPTAERLLRQFAGSEDPTQSPIERLSDRELEVYRLIGQGLGTRQIADHLNLSMKTIETYRDHIKRKLNLQNSNEMVRHAVQWHMENSTS